MRSITYNQAFYFFIYVVVQLPLIYRFVLLDIAFAFFYVGFLLLLPPKQNRIVALLLAFFTGLLIDMFSNTPGVHASACVLLVFMKNSWLRIVRGVEEDDFRISAYSLGFQGMMLYALPLIFAHHFIIFFLEHGSFSEFGTIFVRVFLSALLSFTIILLSNYLVANREKRL